jgi:hypothetical protein
MLERCSSTTCCGRCPKVHYDERCSPHSPKKNRTGLIPEYTRRLKDLRAPVGSLVKPKARTYSVRQRTESRTFTACYDGLAAVLAQPVHGGYVRYLMLLPPWRDLEGNMLQFVEASSYELEIVK